jgi:hypothetical protein
MKKVNILRMETTASGLIGVLMIDGIIDCFTMQPDPTDVHFSIPVGNYLCRRYHSEKFPDTFEIVVQGHTALLFHVMNLEDESKGCIGLGESVGYLKGKRAVLSSGVAFEQFMKGMGGDQQFNLIIEDWAGLKRRQ